MKTTLVNHSGIIQEKFLIKTHEDVIEYQKISARQNGEHMFDSDKPNTIRDAIISLSQISGDSMLITAIKMNDTKIMNIDKEVSKGNTAVVNMAGGWMVWDDSAMSLVDENNRITISSEHRPLVSIGEHNVLVIENQESISKNITDFIKNKLKEDNYSYVRRLNTDYNHEIGGWIKEALQKGCKTIVLETQLVDKSQVERMVKIFSSLPPMTFHIFTYRNDLKADLERHISVQAIEEVYKRHTIKSYGYGSINI